MTAILTMLSDFGLKDPYVGIMKGVALQRAPSATLVDLTHEIPPQDLRRGALALLDAYRFFPAGTVHLAVVDPGVGTERAAIAAYAHGQIFVAPDNGLLDPILRSATEPLVVRVERSDLYLPYMSDTFHGRDLFAPIAGMLAGRSTCVRELGPVMPSWTPLALPEPIMQEGGADGCILYADHFGNAVTNINADHLAALSPEAEAYVVDVVGEALPLCRTYSDLPENSAGGLIGSSGRIEIAVRNGNASEVLQLTADTPVRIRHLQIPHFLS